MSVDDVLKVHFPAYGRDDVSAEWASIKKLYRCGDQVTGTIVAKFPFGLIVDFGASLPGLLLVTRIPDLSPEQYQLEPVYQEGHPITARIYCFAEKQKEIGLTQKRKSEQSVPPDPSAGLIPGFNTVDE